MASLQERVRSITNDVSYGSQLASMITELSLSDGDAKKVFATIDLEILSSDVPFVKALAEIARYEGFNPRQVIHKLLQKHGEVERRVRRDPSELESCSFEVEVEVNGERRIKPVTFTNNMKFNEDIQMICLMFITRGAVVDKIEKKSNDSMKKIMRMLKVKYDINTTKRKPGTALDSEVITIPRISASFPNITVGWFHMGFGRSIIDQATLFPEVELPRAIMSPMVASILPQSANTPLIVLFAIAVKIDDILHQTDNKTTLSNLQTYLMASYNSTATTELVKIKACTHWNIGQKINGQFVYNELIINCKPRAKEIIRMSRPTDVALEAILSSM